MGWKNTELILNEQGYDPSLNFLVTDKYQTSSELSFYSKGQKRAYFLNLQEARRNQFSYWPSLQEVEKNKTGFFVWVENTPLFERQVDERKTFYKKELQNFFEEVELAGTFTIPGKGLVLFRCKNPIENKTTEKMYF
jgi:hypothetical protein